MVCVHKSHSNLKKIKECKGVLVLSWYVCLPNDMMINDTHKNYFGVIVEDTSGSHKSGCLLYYVVLREIMQCCPIINNHIM